MPSPLLRGCASRRSVRTFFTAALLGHRRNGREAHPYLAYPLTGIGANYQGPPLHAAEVREVGAWLAGHNGV